MTPELAERCRRIDLLLPQSQCRQCGFEGCSAYAGAIARGEAPINRCAAGGAAGIRRIAELTGLPVVPLDPEYGTEKPFAVARIRASECIGCRRCIRACPTDAIIGAPKRLHAVVSDACTGCSLCQAACPLACIDMVETGEEWTPEKAAAARARQMRRLLRLAREETESEARYRALGQGDEERKRAAIAAILALDETQR